MTIKPEGIAQFARRAGVIPNGNQGRLGSDLPARKSQVEMCWRCLRKSGAGKGVFPASNSASGRTLTR